jgi:hypothetical protein
MEVACRPDQKTLIPDLLRKAPQARAILDRYGLRRCGGRLGVESLGFFARAHDVPVDRLLSEIRNVCQSAPENLLVEQAATADARFASSAR